MANIEEKSQDSVVPNETIIRYQKENLRRMFILWHEWLPTLIKFRST